MTKLYPPSQYAAMMSRASRKSPGSTSAKRKAALARVTENCLQPKRRVIMPKYRKKPVEIEAVQFHEMGDHPAVFQDDRSPTGFAIHTWENTEIQHEVTPGDWIITGVKGETYPCKPDVFAATYDPV